MDQWSASSTLMGHCQPNPEVNLVYQIIYINRII